MTTLWSWLHPALCNPQNVPSKVRHPKTTHSTNLVLPHSGSWTSVACCADPWNALGVKPLPHGLPSCIEVSLVNSCCMPTELNFDWSSTTICCIDFSGGRTLFGVLPMLPDTALLPTSTSLTGFWLRSKVLPLPRVVCPTLPTIAAILQ